MKWNKTQLNLVSRKIQGKTLFSDLTKCMIHSNPVNKCIIVQCWKCMCINLMQFPKHDWFRLPSLFKLLWPKMRGGKPRDYFTCPGAVWISFSGTSWGRPSPAPRDSWWHTGGRSCPSRRRCPLPPSAWVARSWSASYTPPHGSSADDRCCRSRQ